MASTENNGEVHLGGGDELKNSTSANLNNNTGTSAVNSVNANNIDGAKKKNLSKATAEVESGAAASANKSDKKNGESDAVDAEDKQADASIQQIGRASCRERV